MKWLILAAALLCPEYAMAESCQGQVSGAFAQELRKTGPRRGTLTISIVSCNIMQMIWSFVRPALSLWRVKPPEY